MEVSPGPDRHRQFKFYPVFHPPVFNHFTVLSIYSSFCFLVLYPKASRLPAKLSAQVAKYVVSEEERFVVLTHSDALQKAVQKA